MSVSNRLHKQLLVSSLFVVSVYRHEFSIANLLCIICNVTGI